ncbi:MAG: hypothetical protein ACRCYO_14500, partial [Bacteroidia bacterium]
LFRIFERLLRNSIWGVLLSALVFTSTLLSFYGISFLADVSAFSLAMLGVWWLYKYALTKKQMWLFCALGISIIASLMKATALFSLFLIACFVVLQHIGMIRSSRRNVPRPGLFVLGSLVVAGLVALWYVYAASFNEKHDAGYFLVGILPIWEMSRETINSTSQALIHFLAPDYFNRPVFIFLFLMCVFLLVKTKQFRSFWFWLFLSSLFLFCVFLTLFFQVFDVHDYYLTNMLPFVVAMLAVTSFLFRQKFYALFKNRFVYIGLFLIVCLSTWNCAIRTRVRFSSIDPLVENSTFLSEKETTYWKKYRSFESLFLETEKAQPLLRKLGIRREDKVYVLPDPSINISLTLMDQRGFTQYGISPNERQTTIIPRKISEGASYMIFIDPAISLFDDVKPYTDYPLGRSNTVWVYDLRPYKK